MGDVFTELRKSLIQAEAVRKEASGVEQGVWVEGFSSTTPGLSAAPASAEEEAGPGPAQFYYNRLMMERYGLLPKGSAVAPAENETPAATPAAGAKSSTPASTNEIAVINLKLRGVSGRKFDPTANDKLVYAVEKQLQANPIFDTKETKLSGQIENVDDAATTFSFGVTLKLKQPMKL